MNWTPSRLTREQMEERRLEGGRLLKTGKLSQAEIARRLGVSRTAVNKWKTKMKGAGLRSLRRQKAKGAQSKLTPEQQKRLKRFLDRGALACGFATDRWTLQRVAELIRREFGVSYHPHYLNRLLDKLGFSPQKPLPRAVEQKRALVRAWLERDFPRLKKVPAARRRDRVLGRVWFFLSRARGNDLGAQGKTTGVATGERRSSRALDRRGFDPVGANLQAAF